MRNSSSLSLILLGAACGADPSNVVGAPPPARTASPAPSGRFVMDVDPGAGTARIRAIDVATSGRGLHVVAPVVQNGDPNGNPPGTYQLVTTDARLPGEDTTPPTGNLCPETDNCFTVRLDSFLARAGTEVTLVVDSVSPSRTMSNPDAAPAGSGLSSALGIKVFGDVAAGGSATREIAFTIPDLTPYTVWMTLYEAPTTPPPGVFASWRFDGDADDDSGNGFNASSNTGTFVGGRYGQALSLVGTQVAVVPFSPTFEWGESDSDYTISY